MPPHRLIENANHFLSSQSAGAFDSEPEDFSLIGYVFIAGGLTLMVAVGAATSSCVSNLTSCISNPTVLSSVGYYGVAIPLGQSIVLVGAIFAGAGFVTEHLRPPEVRETEDAFLVESEGQKSLFSCPECDAEVEPTATFCSNCGNLLRKN